MLTQKEQLPCPISFFLSSRQCSWTWPASCTKCRVFMLFSISLTHSRGQSFTQSGVHSTETAQQSHTPGVLMMFISLLVKCLNVKRFACKHVCGGWDRIYWWSPARSRCCVVSLCFSFHLTFSGGFKSTAHFNPNFWRNVAWKVPVLPEGWCTIWLTSPSFINSQLLHFNRSSVCSDIFMITAQEKHNAPARAGILLVKHMRWHHRNSSLAGIERTTWLVKLVWGAARCFTWRGFVSFSVLHVWFQLAAFDLQVWLELVVGHCGRSQPFGRLNTHSPSTKRRFYPPPYLGSPCEVVMRSHYIAMTDSRQEWTEPGVYAEVHTPWKNGFAGPKVEKWVVWLSRTIFPVCELRSTTMRSHTSAVAVVGKWQQIPRPKWLLRVNFSGRTVLALTRWPSGQTKTTVDQCCCDRSVAGKDSELPPKTASPLHIW